MELLIFWKIFSWLIFYFLLTCCKAESARWLSASCPAPASNPDFSDKAANERSSASDDAGGGGGGIACDVINRIASRSFRSKSCCWKGWNALGRSPVEVLRSSGESFWARSPRPNFRSCSPRPNLFRSCCCCWRCCCCHCIHASSALNLKKKKSNFLKLRLNQSVTQSWKWAFVLCVVKIRSQFNGTK